MTTISIKHGVNPLNYAADGLAHVVYTLHLWHERAKQRRALQALTDDQLRDVGISRPAARVESSKPFWRA